MPNTDNTRREFIQARTAAVAAASLGAVGAAGADASKTLNFNPKMGYRRLGKTEFTISEVSLGGHGGSTVKDRVPVLERAVELGINYVDNNIAAECDLYGKAMAQSSSAKRDRWFIGFASWPQKITTEFEAQLTKDGMLSSIDDRLQSYRTDVLDMWRPVGATWGEGQRSIATLLMVSHKALDLVVEVFEKGKRSRGGGVFPRKLIWT